MATAFAEYLEHMQLDAWSNEVLLLHGTTEENTQGKTTTKKKKASPVSMCSMPLTTWVSVDLRVVPHMVVFFIVGDRLACM